MIVSPQFGRCFLFIPAGQSGGIPLSVEVFCVVIVVHAGRHFRRILASEAGGRGSQEGDGGGDGMGSEAKGHGKEWKGAGKGTRREEHSSNTKQ